jgi:aerobic-type carbon monoxide dehydrogenase small subunit (CoxS/CutS family)
MSTAAARMTQRRPCLAQRTFGMEMNAGRRPEPAESATGIVVNGEWHELSPATSGTLLALLRSGLGLTGAKPGCGEGECGACTVLVDGRPVLACQTAVAEVEGRSVTTVEGLADRQRLHPVQQTLATEHGFQCGYCTPATVISQIQGGIVMALGGALFEQVMLADGHQETRSLAGYRVPRFSDIPQIDVVLVDRPDIPSAGAGETPLIAVAPAISNAIFAATGRRLRALPLLAGDGPLRVEDDVAGG